MTAVAKQYSKQIINGNKIKSETSDILFDTNQIKVSSVTGSVADSYMEVSGSGGTLADSSTSVISANPTIIELNSTDVRLTNQASLSPVTTDVSGDIG